MNKINKNVRKAYPKIKIDKIPILYMDYNISL